MRLLRHLDSENRICHAALQPDGTALRVEGGVFTGWIHTGEPADVRKRLCPLQPTQILGIGLNYRQHAAETGAKLPERPLIFGKSVACAQNPGDPIILPRHLRSDEVDFEAELGVVIGRDAKNVPRERALDYVLGYVCANDVSARDHQKRLGGGQWWRGKSFDTFAPLGPVLVTRDEIPDPQALAIELTLNGEVMQRASTSDMIFDVATLVSFLSGSTTLPAGTVILTGTPQGVGMARTPPRWLQPGDVVRVTIEGLGSLENPVVAESA
ncbi:fumarylacetoacetate hydrolase family protein [Nibricoccus sp. IMCC34717]|uniref:fumarylacetoacetate hydrolase family protein n=1 Tax=Nibricoccus sp. IMCC34717 TaxID=3034021 RepID=UPI00384BB47E